MPYLNLKDPAQGVRKQEVAPAPGESMRERHVMRLTLEPAAVSSLLPMLREIFDAPAAAAHEPRRLGGELRVDLPREWIVFWKPRDGESRLLLAHPQPEEWVATVALSEGDGKELIRRMESMESLPEGQSLRLNEWVAPGSVSNLELELMRA
jgi:hypothetical protein